MIKKLSLTLLSLACIALSPTAFTQTIAAIATEQHLKDLIECKSNSASYTAFTEDYENNLAQLGWKRKDDPHQPFLYIYQHKQALNVFGRPTQEIALAGQGVVAVYRNTDYKPLAKQLGIQQHPDFEGIPLFRGEKLIHTEAATADRFTHYTKMILSEMTGKSPMIILGCTYEFDKAEFEKSFNLNDEDDE